MEPALEDLRRIRRRLHENREERAALIDDRATAFVFAHRDGASAAELAEVLGVPVVDVEMALRATFPPEAAAADRPAATDDPARDPDALAAGEARSGEAVLPPITTVPGPSVPSTEPSPAPR